MFIDLDNSLTGILHVIAQIVEAAGGLKGVFDIAVFTAFSLLGDKIANGFRNAANSAMLLVGIEQKHLRSMQNEAMTQSKMLEIYDGMSDQQGVEVQITQMRMERQQEINKLNGYLTEEQQNQIKLRETELQLLEEIVLKNQELLNQQQKENQEQGQKDNKRATKGTTISSNQANQIRNARESAEALLGKKNKVKAVDSTGILAKNGKGTSDNEEIQQVASYLTKLQKAVGQANHESLAFNKSWQTLNKEQQKSPEILRTILKNLNFATDKLSDDEIVKKVQEINQQAEQTERVLEELDISIRNVGSDPANSRAFINGLVETDEAAARTNASLNALREKSDNYKDSIVKGTFTIRDWATTIVSATQAIAGFSMAMQSLDTLINVWSDDTMEFGDRIIQTLMSIGMIIPGFIQTAQQLSNIIIGNKYVQQIQAAEKALLGLKKGTKAYEEAENALTKAIQAEGVARNSANLYMMAAMVIIMAVMEIYKLYQAQQERERKALEERAEKSKEAADNVKKEAEANQVLVKSMKDALKTYEENGNNKAELNETTKNLADAYGLEGSALAELTGRYEDYNNVLQQAEKKQAEEEKRVAIKNLGYVADVKEQLVNTFKSTNLAKTTLMSTAGGYHSWQTIDSQIARDLKGAGLVDQIDEQIFFNHGIVNNVTVEGIIKTYNQLVKGIKLLDATYESSQLASSDYYANMKNDANTLQGLIKDYYSYNAAAQVYLIKSENPFKDFFEKDIFRTYIDETGKSIEYELGHLDTFTTKISHLENELSKSGIGWSLMDEAIQSIIESSDEEIQKLYAQYKIVLELEEKYKDIYKGDWYFNLKSLYDTLGEENIDYTVVGRINWNLIDDFDKKNSERDHEKFNADVVQAYNRAEVQRNAEVNLQTFQDIANGITTIQSNLNDKMTETQYQAIADAIDWGKNNLIELNEFLNMSSEQQTQYLNQIYAASYEAYINQSQIYLKILKKNFNETQQTHEQILKNITDNEINASQISNMNIMKSFVKDIKNASDFNTKKELTEQYQEQFNDAYRAVFSREFTGDLVAIAEDGFQKIEDEFNQDYTKNGLDFNAQANLVLKEEQLDSTIKDLQEQMDKTNKEIEIKSRLLVDLKIQNYENYFSSFETLFEQLSSGVKKAFDENGQTIWKFTDEARKAFRTLYPEYAAQLKYMNDGTWAITNEMYQSWFNMNNGMVKSDIENVKASLAADKEKLQSKIDTIDIAIAALESESMLTEEQQKSINDAVNDSYVLQTDLDESALESAVNSNKGILNSGTDTYEQLDSGSLVTAENFDTYFKNATDNVCNYFNTAKNAAANMWKTVITGEQTPDLTTNGMLTTSVSAGKQDLPTTDNIKNYLKDYLDNTDKFNYDDWVATYVSNAERKVANEKLAEVLKNKRKSLQDQMSAIDSAYASIDSILNDYNNKVNNGGSGSSSKVSKPNEVQKAKEIEFKTDEIEELFTTFDKLDREIEKVNKSIEKVNREIENNIGYKKEEAIQRKRELLQQNTQKQKEKQQRIIQELTDAGFDIGEIDSETGQFSNYEQIMANLREQRVNNQNNYNATASRFDEQWKLLDQERENIQKESDDLWNEFEEGKINQKTYEEKKKAIEQKEESYNAKKQTFERDSQAALKIAESLYDSEEKRLQGLQDLIEDSQDKYIETVETIDNNKIEEQNLLTDAFVEQFDQIQERADDIHNFNEFINTYFTQFDDILNYGTHMIEKYSSNAKASLSAFSGYQEQYYKILSNSDLADSQKSELIRQLVENMRNEITDIFDQISNMTDTLLEMYDEVQERFDKITEDIQRRNSRLSSYQDILALQGYDSVRSKEGRAFYKQAANTRLTNLQNEYGVEQSRLAYWESQRQTAFAELSKLNDSNDPQKLLRAQIKNSLEKIEENYQQSQDRMIEITQESLELIKEMYNNTLDQQLYDYEKDLTGGLGFNQLQTNIDYNFEAEERYLDMVNEEYAVKEYGRQLDKAINNAQNKYAAEQYENLRDEMEQRRANGKLSQYDLDLMNSKLEVTKAQMALEEAQNAKSTVRLVRNSAGNWDYQFTADQNKIDEAQSKYDKAVNDSYNLAKNYYKTNMQNIIALRQQTYSQIEQIVKDETLNETQKEEAIKKVREQSLEKYQYLMSEMKIAQSDMNEFGKATTNDYYNVFKGVTEGLDLSYKNFEESFDKNTNKMKQTFSYFGQLLNSTASTMSSDLNSVKKEMQDLTTATNDWKNATSDAIGEINSHKNELNDFVTLVKDLNKALEGSKEAVGAVGFTSGADLNVADNKILGEQYRQTTDEKTKEFLRDRMKDNLQKQNIIITDKEIEQAINDYINEVDIMQLAIDKFRDPWADNSEIEELLKRRNNKIDFWGLKDKKISTIEQLRKYIKENGLATGGYTGEFSGARLAFLHEKELILNKTDTQNILSAVAAVRELAPALLEKIGQSLNGQILAGRSLMESRMNVYKPSFSAEAQPIEQNVIIQADFPGVSAAVEIEAALNNLINDATQYASVVRG